ncbi:hypothetical protein BLOT_000224 [Blomia tropicalis]|nr:hypothetical protein BLOT_000224 [Blomia tropicalis]
MSQLNPMDHSRRKLVILLGEGNFSFAVKLATQFIDSEENFKFIATDYVCDKQSLNKEIEDINDKLCDLNIDERIQDNIRILSSHPHFIIWLDVDATNLDSHQGLCNELSNPTNESVIFVFNFPHVKNIKMKIHLNRNFWLIYFEALNL